MAPPDIFAARIAARAAARAAAGNGAGNGANEVVANLEPRFALAATAKRLFE